MAYEDRDSFRQDIRNRLSEFDRDADRWMKGTRAGERDTRPEVESVRTRRRDLDDRIKGMDDVAEDKWDDFKRDVDRAWEGLKADFNRMKPK